MDCSETHLVNESGVVVHSISDTFQTPQFTLDFDEGPDLFQATVDQPEERMELFGIESLTDSEVLRLLIGGEHAQEVADKIMADNQGLQCLAKMPATELQNIKGIDSVSANRIPVAVELARRILIPDKQIRHQIRSPEDVVACVRSEMVLRQQEVLYTLCLDIKNIVRHLRQLYVGNLNCVPVRMAEIFRPAICTNSASMILVHNHPSGDPTPSPDDVHMTEVAVDAGHLLDIELLDHVIIGQGTYVSMRERNLGFS